MDQLKARSEIEVLYQWDISKIFKNETEIEESIDRIKENHEKILAYRGNIMKDGTNLYDFYQLDESYERELDKLYVYASMLCDSDTTDSNNQSLKMRIEKLYEDLSSELSFIQPELLSVSKERVLELIKENPNLEKYRFDLEKILRYKPHVLTEKEEELIAKANNAMGTGYSAFYNLDNADCVLGTIENEQGEAVELTNSNYVKFLNSKDRRVRKDAFMKMYAYWEGIKNTVAATYKGQIKENHFNADIRNYLSPLEASLFNDHIDIKVYTNLIETVHQNLDKMYDYLLLRKQILKLDDLHLYDTYVDLCEDVPKEIYFEEAKTIINESLKPLGEQYVTDLKKAYDERWIDIYPNKGKKSGAYSSGTYDTYPYLLLNYVNTMDSLSTMTHELGHSMHSYYSNKHQSYTYHNYPIFSAEIASTVNELLLNDYLSKQAKTKEEKILYINEFLDKVKSTLFRQTMFAEFEKVMHDKYKAGIPLTEKEFSDTYYDINKLYMGDNVIVDNEIRYEWERIPHFYSSFYTYKYATGISAAVAIASDILTGVEGTKERYLEFLASGASNYPLELLKKAGVDMTSPLPIQKALDMFAKKIEELKQLI